MREKLRDFETGTVEDLSTGNIRIFKFVTPEGLICVVWDSLGNGTPENIDLSSVLGKRDVRVTGIITELNRNDTPVLLEVITCPTASIPVGITPVFIELP
jgi:hypothetical protein